MTEAASILINVHVDGMGLIPGVYGIIKRQLYCAVASWKNGMILISLPVENVVHKMI